MLIFCPIILCRNSQNFAYYSFYSALLFSLYSELTAIKMKISKSEKLFTVSRSAETAKYKSLYQFQNLKNFVQK